MNPLSQLLRKYDTPAPRYTSYPTVPYWQDSPTELEWVNSLRKALKVSGSQIALYLHIPFCESLCTFCGCNTVITKDHGVENPYVSRLLKELELYMERVPELSSKRFRQIHFGGGTPTFLSVSELDRLITGIYKNVPADEKHFDGSVEVDPRRTTTEQLELFKKHGFKRISFGVQDFNLEVQRVVNRIQPYEMTAKMTSDARELGYESINFDLIYGLPKQTLELFKDTIAKTLTLRPDRIALYSFALVPWVKKVQRIFKDEDLPEPEEKRALYEYAREKFLNAGYVEIGMDHFALPNESLAVSMKSKTLHRNFMGYTELKTDVLLGLGLSSISESPDCFYQNLKVLPEYERALDQGFLPGFRGHLLSDSDLRHRAQILELMTTGTVFFQNESQREAVRARLSEPLRDGLAMIQGMQLSMTDKGRPFLRNIGMAFDERLLTKAPETRVFSQSI